MSLRWIPVLFLLLPSALQAAPTVTFEPGGVRAGGITAGGKAVLFSVSREGQGFSLRSASREEILEDTDKDGVVLLDLGKAAPFRSIWAVIDLTSGEHTLASPEGYTPTVIELPPGALRGNAGGNGKPDRVDDRRYALEVLVVRPGQGAWRQSLGDGDPDDEDGATNGRIQWATAKGKPVKDGAAAPADFDPGDVIIAIDPVRMEVYTVRLPGGRP